MGFISSYLLFFVVITIFFISSPHCCCWALPVGFESEIVVDITDAVDVEFVSSQNNMMMFAITIDGEVYTVDLSDNNRIRKRKRLDLRDNICDNGQRGLLGITVHPNFEVNRWIYLYYTYNNEFWDCPLVGPVNRCSRFVVDDNWDIDIDSEVVLFTQYQGSNDTNNGGSMAFGVDGMLYVATGDSGATSSSDLQWSQALWNLHGSIIRITDTGGIPNDNPFTGGGASRCSEMGRTDEDKVCQEIYSYGLHNPTKIIMDPYSTNKVRYLITDVGETAWEEVNVGGDDYSGSNYGWPIREGPCAYNKVDVSCFVSGSGPPDPYYWYQHNTQMQGSVSGIAIFPPNGEGWPSPYSDRNSFYISDFDLDRILHVTEDADAICSSCNPPQPGFRNETIDSFPKPSFLKFGPYPDSTTITEDDSNTSSIALYFNNYQRCCDQFIRRIVYKGGSNNVAPIASYTADHTVIAVGGTVTFNASETIDENDPIESLTFTWNFGDGNEEVEGMVVSHSFDERQVYNVELTVRDPEGATGRYSEWISVGNPPVVEILNPVEGSMFAVGDVITLIGTGVDHNGVPLDTATQLSWEVREHHGTTYSTFLQANTVGNSINLLPAPSHTDLDSATNSYLEVLLTGTDSNGIWTTMSRTILPKTVQLDFDTEPTGLVLVIDGEELTMPQRIVSWENHNLTIFAPQQDQYRFVAGSGCNCSAGEEEGEIVIVVPPTPDGQIRSYILNFETITFPENQTEAPSGNTTTAPTGIPTTESSVTSQSPDAAPSVAPSINPSEFSTTINTFPSNQTDAPLDNSTTNYPTQDPTDSPSPAPSGSPTDVTPSPVKMSQVPSGESTFEPSLPPIVQKTLNPTQAEDNPLIQNPIEEVEDISCCTSFGFGSVLFLTIVWPLIALYLL